MKKTDIQIHVQKKTKQKHDFNSKISRESSSSEAHNETIFAPLNYQYISYKF